MRAIRKLTNFFSCLVRHVMFDFHRHCCRKFQTDLLGKNMTQLKQFKHHLYALHGFLGSANDWKLFDCIDHPIGIGREELNFWEWSEAFNSTIKTDPAKNVLIGYSLGGRLGMHVLLSNPSLWSSAIFISAHPGLSSSEEKAKKRVSDQVWANRFLKEPWDILIQNWNNNPVFAGKPYAMPKEEKDYERDKLAKQLVNWSLGNQDFLLGQLSRLSIPILFVAGELDQKYCKIAEQFRDFAEISIFPEAGHRVPWEQPVFFETKVNEFLTRLDSLSYRKTLS